MFEDRIAALNKDTEAMPSIPYEKRIYTVDEIQDILGIGGNIRILKKSFDEWLDKQMDICQV